MTEIKTFYGLTSQSQAVEIAGLVCKVLGNGKNNVADLLLLETACAETLFGQVKDPTPKAAGNGLCQHDRIPFYDVARRTSEKHRDLVLKHFGIDVRTTKWVELCASPLLALIWCRLHYKLIPEEIPDTRSCRAVYWKKYYNTKAGKGTADHYLQSVKISRLDSFLPTL